MCFVTASQINSILRFDPNLDTKQHYNCGVVACTYDRKVWLWSHCYPEIPSNQLICWAKDDDCGCTLDVVKDIQSVGMLWKGCDWGRWYTVNTVRGAAKRTKNTMLLNKLLTEPELPHRMTVLITNFLFCFSCVLLCFFCFVFIPPHNAFSIVNPLDCVKLLVLVYHPFCAQDFLCPAIQVLKPVHLLLLPQAHWWEAPGGDGWRHCRQPGPGGGHDPQSEGALNTRQWTLNSSWSAVPLKSSFWKFSLLWKLN